MKKIFFALFSIVFLNGTAAQEPSKKLSVISTFSILNDVVKNIGGDYVNAISLVGPNMDVHGYNPTPHDGIALKKADLVFVSGLGLEGWLHQFIKASGFTGEIVTASKGMTPIVDSVSRSGEKVYDPHVWHNFDNITFYVKNILEALQKKDPANREAYTKNAAAFLKEVTETKAWAEGLFKNIPCENRVVITVHDAFQYLGREFGLTFLAPLGINPDAQPAPKDLAKLLGQIKKYKVKSIFLEPVINSSVVGQLAKEANIRVGETLYSDALSGPEHGADTYIKMMRHNLERIARAMCG